jgi:hypothetical protein
VSPLAPVIAVLAEEILQASTALGRPVHVDQALVADRSDSLALQPPGLTSPNSACRLMQAADGWIAANLPRATDREALPAWLGVDEDASWEALARAVRGHSVQALIVQARLLALAVAEVGEVAPGAGAVLVRQAAGAVRPERPLRVVDLSSLWAGPLAGQVLAAMGAQVTKLESAGRPDPVRTATPALHERLNGLKTDAQFDPRDPESCARLGEAMALADVVITSARPRAFDQMGLGPARVFAANPGLVWVAVSGYGWSGDQADRIAFGDDAAVAGGLVRWTSAGEPRFFGDALADPITGLCAAAAAIRALEQGGGYLVDAPLAACAARAAALVAP